MLNRNTILITKDVLKKDYLGCYGSKIWKTPNIDKLAETGNKFINYYTAAPSSVMAYISMFTGLYPHETPRKHFIDLRQFNKCKTLFEKLSEKGYSNHVIWDDYWMKDWELYTGIFNGTQIHNLEISQDVGPHCSNQTKTRTYEAGKITNIIIRKLKEIVECETPVFVWMHLPHVLLSQKGYGSDISLFDKIVGKITEIFPREGIYLTADHGHMDLKKGINAYGFHLYENTINIPMITPKFFSKQIANEVISCTQLMDIILNNKIKVNEYVYADTQYYLQSDRKLMVRKDRYKFIFNKKDKTEELYDLECDPDENINLLISGVYDRDRNKIYKLEEVHYYAHWEKARIAYRDLKAEKERIWIEGKFSENMVPKSKSALKSMNKSVIYRNRKLKSKGRWDTLVKQ